MIDPKGAVMTQVSNVSGGYELGYFGLIIWVLLQQSNKCEVKQLFDPQKGLLWHSLLESQSPSYSPQGIPDTQKSSCPTVGW